MKPHLFVCLAALTASAVAQSQLLLPDHHHLSEGLAAAAGSTAYWGTAARRFQILYDASHFTNSGVIGAITINELAFRGEDGEANKGGQTYYGITINVYSTTLNSTAALSTTFANNLPPTVATSTLLGSTAIASLVLPPSLATCPGTYMWTLPLTGIAAFDPTSGQPNLLVDINYTSYTANIGTAPVPNTNAPAVQDTTGTSAQIRGRALTALGAAAVTGAVSATPVIMRVGFSGSGGYSALTPAQMESIGSACGGAPSGFYQVHRHTELYDLSGPGQVDGLTGLTLTPDVYPSPNFYVVTGGAAAVDLVNGVTGVANSTGDDATYAHALPGTFDYPGGSTAAIRPSTNGYVIVSAASVETAADFSCTIPEWLNNVNSARFAPCWHDFHAGRNAVSNPGAGLYSRNVGSVCLVTWNVVGSFDVTTGDNEKHTFQCAIDTATGVVEFRYGTMTTITCDTLDDGVAGGDFINCISGFSRGQISGIASVDAQSRDLSIERPFSTQVEGSFGNMGLSAVSAPAPAPNHYQGRMYRGQSILWNVSNIPALQYVGILVLDATAARPGLQALALTAPGCSHSFGLLSGIGHEVALSVVGLPTSLVGAVPFLVPGGYNPTILGAEIYAQYVCLDGGPNLFSVTSNTLKHTVGLQ